MSQTKMTTEEWLAVSTVALAVVTGGLVVVATFQLGWMKKHAEHLEALTKETGAIAKAAQDSATAAKDSVDLARTSLHQVERPWLTFEMPIFQMGEGGINTNPASFHLKVTNVGKSPAMIKATNLEVQLGGPPALEKIVPQDAGGYALGAGDAKMLTVSTFTLADLNGSASAYLVCRVEYEDVLGRDSAGARHLSSDIWMRSPSDGQIRHIDTGMLIDAKYRQFT